jgi:predicted PurR-regulated permease PerM
MVFLAATSVVLAGMRLGAPVVTPTRFALVLSLIFSPIYSWLLGAPGAFLAMPITLLLAAMFDTFPETRWLAGLTTTSPATDAPAPGVEVGRAG